PLTCALSGCKPVSASAVMVLPEPLSPIIPKRSPRLSVKLTSLTAAYWAKRTARLATSSKDIGISLPQSRVDGIAQPIPGEVECDHDGHDAQARRQCQPGMHEKQALRIPQHQPQACSGGLRAQANIAQSRLGQDAQR